LSGGFTEAQGDIVIPSDDHPYKEAIILAPIRNKLAQKKTPVWLLILAFILSGCITSGRSVSSIAHPIRLSTEAVDKVTDEKANAALAHTLNDKKLCGWKESQ
jgi:hypothetical protein